MSSKSTMISPFSDTESIKSIKFISATGSQPSMTSPFDDNESIASINPPISLFSDTDSITPSESASATGPPSTIMANPFDDTESITSPFSDTESISSTNSTSSRRTTASSLSHASSRTSIDWADANADSLNEIAEQITKIANNLQQSLAHAQAINEAHSAFIRHLEDEPEADTASSSALEEERVGADIEASDSGVTEAAAVAEANLASSRRIEMQLPAFLERQRAVAQAAAVRDARPRFFKRVVDKVKERFSGLMA